MHRLFENIYTERADTFHKNKKCVGIHIAILVSFFNSLLQGEITFSLYIFFIYSFPELFHIDEK